MTMQKVSEHTVNSLSLPLEREGFFGTLIRELSGTLLDLVGLEEASGWII